MKTIAIVILSTILLTSCWGCWKDVACIKAQQEYELQQHKINMELNQQRFQQEKQIEEDNHKRQLELLKATPLEVQVVQEKNKETSIWEWIEEAAAIWALTIGAWVMAHWLSKQ